MRNLLFTICVLRRRQPDEQSTHFCWRPSHILKNGLRKRRVSFAGITGDLSPNHVNKEFMRKTSYGKRIAHGALLVGYMSNCSTAILVNKNSPDETPVSLGYDRVRFIAPVFIGDTIFVTYRVESIDETKRESRADISVRNQTGEMCAIATHILRWVPNES